MTTTPRLWASSEQALRSEPGSTSNRYSGAGRADAFRAVVWLRCSVCWCCGLSWPWSASRSSRCCGSRSSASCCSSPPAYSAASVDAAAGVCPAEYTPPAPLTRHTLSSPRHRVDALLHRHRGSSTSVNTPESIPSAENALRSTPGRRARLLLPGHWDRSRRRQHPRSRNQLVPSALQGNTCSRPTSPRRAAADRRETERRDGYLRMLSCCGPGYACDASRTRII
jgi:hypothetical protein